MGLFNRWLHNSEIGRNGEDIAAAEVKREGLKIVERNWRAGKSEIDIIAISKRKKELHIIEVKSRTNSSWEEVGSSLTAQKINALRRGALEYKNSDKRYLDYSLVFDVVVVFFNDRGQNVEYVKNIRF